MTDMRDRRVDKPFKKIFLKIDLKKKGRAREEKSIKVDNQNKTKQKGRKGN